MIDIERPAVSFNKTTEANINALRNWADSVTDQLSYQLSAMENALAQIEKEIETLKGETK